ncbi:cytochrome P450 3A28 [Trichonephila clavata]|uniref:Cytochrome P450 3A28 n=1 Tax=Trichonephila clavata TaxID=2740835 RepID=A0A8X6FJ73_TRICU|nr:cytochrome P450 3A28 [Trichonephila clavata]
MKMVRKIWKCGWLLLGYETVVLVADVDLLKRIQVSDFHKFINRPNLFMVVLKEKSRKPPPRVEGFSQQMITLRDKRWKEIRSIITHLLPLQDEADGSYNEQCH